VVADNPADGVGLVAALPPAAPGADAKRALLAELGSRPGTGRGGRHLLTRAGLAPLSESALRVLCATPEELAASHARRALRGARPAQGHARPARALHGRTEGAGAQGACGLA
jgi:hypothetical protein